MIRKTAGIFSIIVGLSIIGMWLMFYFTGSISELDTEPARIIMHLMAEFVTALALIVGGWGQLKLKAWGEKLYLLATGALIYTIIQSPGYFLQTGEVGFVVIFNQIEIRDNVKRFGFRFVIENFAVLLKNQIGYVIDIDFIFALLKIRQVYN